MCVPHEAEGPGQHAAHKAAGRARLHISGVFAERCGAQDITAYHVDPEQLHNTKTTGIFTEAWLRRDTDQKVKEQDK